ncbi:MAG: hypothetical protein IIA10_04410 [Proteobacteria bacterium]|nr:hypothetical protein [Pseudomonadota bacterium]
MMNLNQITAQEWTLTDNRDRVLASFEADDDLDAMSFVASQFPGRPCVLNVQDYEAAIAAAADMAGIAA